MSNFGDEQFWWWISVIDSAVPKTAEDVTQIAFKVFTEWGYPQILHTDNGEEFTALVDTKRYEEYGIEIQHGTPRRPQTQGGIESVHKVIESEAVKYLMENDTNY